MIGNIQLCLFKPLSPEVRENLEDAQIAGEILLQFINNILDGGKSEAGSLEIRPATTDIQKLCEKVWSISRKIIHNKGLIGSFSLATRVPRWLLIDNYRITQILLNLISNSVKYTERGKISIRIDWINNQGKIREI